MQGQQRELPRANPFNDPRGGGRLDLGVADMAPPNQDVDRIQIPQTLLRIIDTNGINGQSREGPQVVSDLVSEPIRVSLLLGWLALVPDTHPDPGGLRSLAARGRHNSSTAHQPFASGDHGVNRPVKPRLRQHRPTEFNVAVANR